MQSAWSCAHRLSVTAIRGPRFIAKKHVPAPRQPSSLVTTPQRNVSPSPAAPHLAAQGGPSQSGFHEQFFALFCSFSPHFALPGQPGTHCPRPGGTPHSYSLRDLFCCLLFYRGEQNSAEEAGLLSMKPIPERTSTALLAG